MKYTIAILFPVWLTAQVAADDFRSRKELAITEGTAGFKCSVNLPVSDRQIFVPSGVPSDHYLRMTGDGGRLLRGEMSLDDLRKTYVH